MEQDINEQYNHHIPMEQGQINWSEITSQIERNLGANSRDLTFLKSISDRFLAATGEWYKGKNPTRFRHSSEIFLRQEGNKLLTLTIRDR